MQAARARNGPRMLKGRLYDVAAALTRVGVGWMFAEYSLGLRGREPHVAERLSEAGLPSATAVATLLPVVLVSLSVAFAVGLLTWLSGPLLAGAALGAALTTDAESLAPFGSWPTTTLVTAVCVLMAVGGGQWSWDRLVLGPKAPQGRRRRARTASATRGKAPAVSPRRPEHAPPLLYPLGQAAFRRPYRL